MVEAIMWEEGAPDRLTWDDQTCFILEFDHGDKFVFIELTEEGMVNLNDGGLISDEPVRHIEVDRPMNDVEILASKIFEKIKEHRACKIRYRTFNTIGSYGDPIIQICDDIGNHLVSIAFGPTYVETAKGFKFEYADPAFPQNLYDCLEIKICLI
jgi:hypothetical protein